MKIDSRSVTFKQFRDLTGCPERTFFRLRKAGVLPVVARGRLDLHVALRAWAEHLQRHDAPGAARATYYAEQARGKKLANDLAEGRLVDAEQMQQAIMAVMGRLVLALEYVPGRHARKLVNLPDGAHAKHAMQDIVREVREELARAALAEIHLHLPEGESSYESGAREEDPRTVSERVRGKPRKATHGDRATDRGAHRSGRDRAPD